MDFDLNPDQALLADTLDKWAARHREIPGEAKLQAFIDGRELAEELHAEGFFDIARTPELGVLGAVLLIEAAGRTPYAIELGASALVAPALGLGDGLRPMAMLRAGGRPVARFLQPGGSALVDCGDHLRLLDCGGDAKLVDSVYAYPIGRYFGDVLARATVLADVPIARFRRLRCIAVIAEALAAMDAALALTLEHVTTRVQFGRPIGSFQALQHRLSECSAAISAARWLLYRAACGEAQNTGDPVGEADDTLDPVGEADDTLDPVGEADDTLDPVGEADHTLDHAGEAAIVAHDTAKRVIYESTQFHGALGLTLEYPLHLWTYRLRALQIELAQAAAEASA